MTRNARLLLASGLLGVLVGGLLASMPLLSVSLSALALVGLEGALFVWTAWVRFPRAVLLRREIRGLGAGGVAWLRIPLSVRLSLESRSRIPFGPVEIEDLPPAAAGPRRAGASLAAGWTRVGRPLEAAYEIVPERIGVFRFSGVRVRLHSGRGLFTRELLRDLPAPIRVLAPLGAEGRWLGFPKHANRLVLQGFHPYRQKGTGTEFLELRDFQPGDPPRRIAWKISAKRGRLMTRDVESEVPMNATVIVDASGTMFRREGGRTRRDRAAECAARVVQAAFHGRDSVGLRIIGGGTDRRLPSGRGRSHLLRILWALSEDLPAARAGSGALSRRERAAFLRFAAWKHPSLLRRILRRPPLAARLKLVPAGRLRLALAAAAASGAGPGSVDEALLDADALGRAVDGWARSEGLPGLEPGVAPDEDLVAEGREKLRAIAAALLSDLRRARDNEIFVLLSDLEGPPDALGELLAAVRALLARHHRVLALVPEGAEARALRRLGVITGPLDPARALPSVARQFLAMRRERGYRE